MSLAEKIHDFGRLIRFSHTVFALPFALASVALAWPAHPVGLRTLIWILVAMVGARSAAMGFNRLADRKLDALNPRTLPWELPQGKVKVWEVSLLTGLSSLLLVYAAYQLNPLCFALSPVALAIIFFYSLTKRFTWASHLFLGLSLSIAPMGAWLAVSGAPSSNAGHNARQRLRSVFQSRNTRPVHVSPSTTNIKCLVASASPRFHTASSNHCLWRPSA